MSRPAVTVVMPFAGDARRGRAAAGDCSRRSTPGRATSCPFADNSGPGRAPRTRGHGRAATARVARPAHARNAGAERAAQRLDPVPRRRHPGAGRPARRVLRRPRRAEDVGALAGEVVGVRRRAHARRALRRRPQLPQPGGPPRAPLPAARGRGEPDGAPRRVRGSRRLLRGGAGGRGHRLQLAPAAGRAGGSSCGPTRGSSTRTGAPSATCAGSGGATPRAGRGSAAATRASSPSRRCARAVRGRRRRARPRASASAALARRRPPVPRFERARYLALDGVLAVEELIGFVLSNQPRRAAERAVASRSSSSPTASPPRTTRSSSSRGRSTRVRVEAVARGRRGVSPEVARELRDRLPRGRRVGGACGRDGAAGAAPPAAQRRAGPLGSRCGPGLTALAPAAVRLAHDRGARVQALGGGEAQRTARRAGAAQRPAARRPTRP